MLAVHSTQTNKSLIVYPSICLSRGSCRHSSHTLMEYADQSVIMRQVARLRAATNLENLEESRNLTVLGE